MRSSYVFYLATISSLVSIHVYEPPFWDIFIYNKHGYDSPDDQPNPPNIFQTLINVYNSISEPPPGNLLRGIRGYLNRKPDLRLMVMERVAMDTKFLHIFPTSGTTIMSPFYPYAFFLMPTMSHFSFQKSFYLWM